MDTVTREVVRVSRRQVLGSITFSLGTLLVAACGQVPAAPPPAKEAAPKAEAPKAEAAPKPALPKLG